jgi:hypothetical protein
MIDQMERILKRSSWHNERTTTVFGCRDSVKPRKASIATADIPAQIRTKHFQNTSLKRYSYTNQLGHWHLKIRHASIVNVLLSSISISSLAGLSTFRINL